MAPKHTADLVKQLRDLMKNTKIVEQVISAYIIPSTDSHYSEYLADCDKRRGFITGFDGSAGVALVTDEDALLWTDGRYFQQASEQMDVNWTLMKEGLPSTLAMGPWLNKNLPSGSRVGVDPDIYTNRAWNSLKTVLDAAGNQLVPIRKNLIDLIWEDRPPRPTTEVKPLALEFTGRPIADKLAAIRQEMANRKANTLVITALDEIAWVLNLRGSDIEYNPVFFSYLVIHRDRIAIFINDDQVSKEVKEHLLQETNSKPINLRPYDDIVPYLKDAVGHCHCEDLIWVSEQASQAIVSIIPKKALVLEISPVLLMKAVKNPTEIEGMRNAHLKDAAALCCYFGWLEENLDKCDCGITEISGAQKLNIFRSCQYDFVGDSFETISAVGPHASIIHYAPTEETDVKITSDELYLCDSGGQYKDGTTDVTRTVHFGTPTEYEKECFTRVLKGQMKLARSIFPAKIIGNCLDSFARQYLWDVGLDYAHGTGHGIGSYLNVHEGPMGISWRPYPDDPGLEAGMFVSNEPGYYESGKFGIRIEDIVQIVPALTPQNSQNNGFLTFETITLVPKQLKMIDLNLLTVDEIEYLNEYHQKCRELVGPLLLEKRQMKGFDWLYNETQPIKIKRCTCEIKCGCC